MGPAGGSPVFAFVVFLAPDAGGGENLGMDLVFLHGPVASGKLTVAREVARRTGFRLFHNHRTVDLALSLFEFGTPPFVRLRETVWLEAFAEAAAADVSLVFTFHPEATVDPAFARRAVETVEAHGGRVHFVRLVCPEEVIEERLDNPSRTEHGKLTDLALYRKLRAEGAFDFPPLPEPGMGSRTGGENLVTLDTGRLTPEEAAGRVVAALDLK